MHSAKFVYDGCSWSRWDVKNPIQLWVALSVLLAPYGTLYLQVLRNPIPRRRWEDQNHKSIPLSQLQCMWFSDNSYMNLNSMCYLHKVQFARSLWQTKFFEKFDLSTCQSFWIDLFNDRLRSGVHFCTNVNVDRLHNRLLFLCALCCLKTAQMPGNYSIVHKYSKVLSCQILAQTVVSSGSAQFRQAQTHL